MEWLRAERKRYFSDHSTKIFEWCKKKAPAKTRAYFKIGCGSRI